MSGVEKKLQLYADDSAILVSDVEKALSNDLF